MDEKKLKMSLARCMCYLRGCNECPFKVLRDKNGCFCDESPLSEMVGVSLKTYCSGDERLRKYIKESRTRDASVFKKYVLGGVKYGH